MTRSDDFTERFWLIAKREELLFLVMFVGLVGPGAKEGWNYVILRTKITISNNQENP